MKRVPITLFLFLSFALAVEEIFVDDGITEYLYFTDTNDEDIYFWAIKTNTTNFYKTEVEIQISFCSSCGPWKLLYRKGKEPTLAIFDKKLEASKTGNVLKPFEGSLDGITLLPGENVTHYVGLHFQFIHCIVSVEAVNKTLKNLQPKPPIPGKFGELSVQRNGPMITLNLPLATDELTPPSELLYKPYIITIFFGTISNFDWCRWEEITGFEDWSPQTNAFSFAHTDFDEIFVTVAVKSQVTGLISYYQRAKVPFSNLYNYVRTAGEVTIALIIIIPLLVLFSGYSRTFGVKHLAFQFVTLEDSSEEERPKRKDEKEESEVDQVNLETNEAPRIENTEDYHPEQDPFIIKAKKHLLTLIIIQIILQIVTIIISLVMKGFGVDLDSFFAFMMLPILFIGTAGAMLFSRDMILGYLLTAPWISGMQITMMLFQMNFGNQISSILFLSASGSDQYTATDAIVTIVIQSLLAISIMCLLISLSPAAFILIKTKKLIDDVLKGISIMERAMMLISIFNIILVFSWIALMLHYLPLTNFALEWPDIYRLFVVMQVSISLAILSIFCAMAALYHNTTFCVVSIIIQLLQLFCSIYFITTDVQFTDSLFSQIENDVYLATVGLRVAHIVVVLFMLLASILYYRQLETISIFEGIRNTFNKQKRITLFHYIVRTANFVSIISLLVISVTLIIFEITADPTLFPPLYMSYYFFILSTPSSILSETHSIITLLFFSIVIDVMGIFLLFVTPTPDGWIVFFFLPIFKVFFLIVSILTGYLARKMEQSQSTPQTDEVPLENLEAPNIQENETEDKKEEQRLSSRSVSSEESSSSS